jgi:hypothetical protein
MAALVLRPAAALAETPSRRPITLSRAQYNAGGGSRRATTTRVPHQLERVRLSCGSDSDVTAPGSGRDPPELRR